MKTNHCKMELLKPVNSYKSLLTVYYNTEGKSKNFKILMFNYIQTCCLLWCDTAWCDTLWYDTVWCDNVWCDTVWCDNVRKLHIYQRNLHHFPENRYIHNHHCENLKSHNCILSLVTSHLLRVLNKLLAYEVSYIIIQSKPVKMR